MHLAGTDSSRTIEIKVQHEVIAVSFAEDGRQVVSGSGDGILRRWRVDNGQEIGKPIGFERSEIFAIGLSPDQRWLVCGLRLLVSTRGRPFVSVWDTRTQEKVRDIYGHTDTVFSVDISPDSTKFAAGGLDRQVVIYDLTTGDKLVGPLQNKGAVVAVRFSPNGDRLAAAIAGNSDHDHEDPNSIRVYNSDDGQQLLDVPCWFSKNTAPPLAWSLDGLRLFAASPGEAKCFDTSSGTPLSKWPIPDGHPASIVLSHNQKFVVVATHKAVSFWDISSRTEIGTALKQTSTIWTIALSPTDDYIVFGEQDGTLTIHSLRDILPTSYLTINVSEIYSLDGGSLIDYGLLSCCMRVLPFMNISDTTFKSWMQGDLPRVEKLLERDITHPTSSFHHARALAYRALVRARLKNWDMALNDAKLPSTIGYIANAVAHIDNREHESAMRVFDLGFSVCVPSDNRLLLLMKAIILFECGKHDDAILRVGDLIKTMDDQEPYTTVRAQMFLLLGNKSMREGDNKYAVELFERAQEAIPFRQSPYLTVISLIFGWDFDSLAPAVQLYLWKAMDAVGHMEVSESLSTMVETLGEGVLASQAATDWDPRLIQECLITFEGNGDVAARSDDPKEAIVQYSAALCLNPSNPAGLLVKRSNARAILGLWQDALKDADDAIKTDSSSPWGYERRHAALHGLRRYDEAMTAFTRMFSLVESTLDEDIRQLGKKYVSPSRLEMIVDNIVRGVLKTSPLALINVESGQLCDGPQRLDTFKSEPLFKELVSSMTTGPDDRRIQQVVDEYFRYVMLSHVWEGKEPSFQDVNQVGSVWKLDPSPLNDKLRKFCEMARSDGYRWAWSDTCCIDKTVSTALHQSLKMMYKWYEASAATFVLLVDVPSPSTLGDLTGSIWMTRAWTSQELLAAKVVRFYDRDWKPYVGDTQPNHKESPVIMQELADVIGISHRNLVAFNPDDLTIREKLRLAATRNATVEEDVAYSLIGIFKSDIRPDYGEGDAALGHLLEEIVARSGDVAVLAWTGKSSSYNSCLPASLSVYSQLPCSSPATNNAEMDARTTALRNSLSLTDAILIHDRVTRLPPTRFANRRLNLPCVMFSVRRLSLHVNGNGLETRYRARVSSIGHVEFQTSDSLSLTEPRRLFFVHPWIRDLRDPLDSSTWGNPNEYDSDSDPETATRSSPTSPSQVVSAATMDDYTRALRLVVRLQQPFHALLLQQQPNGEFRRVAADNEIIVPGLDPSIKFARHIRTDVVEIL